MNTPWDRSTILKGFISNAAGWTACPVETPNPLTLSSAEPGIACRLDTLEDLNALKDGHLLSGTRTVTLVYSEVSNLNLTIEEEIDVDACKDQCSLDDRCVAFTVGYNDTSRSLSTPSMCYFFGRSHPYYVYRFSRSGLNESGVTFLTESELADVRSERFGPAVMPYSRLYNSEVGIHVFDDGLHSRDMVGMPRPSKALLLTDCMDECIATADCHAIAYPGCYLLNQGGSDRASGQGERLRVNVTEDVQPTYVFLKRYNEDTVEGVAGFPNRKHFKGEDIPAVDAHLNQPIGCAVDSKGSVHIVDAGNHRIREVSGRHSDCLHSFESDRGVLDHKQATLMYKAATRSVTTRCRNSSEMGSLFDELLNEAVDNRNAAAVVERFCNFNDGPNTTAAQNFYQAYTRNSRILCSACEGLSPRPDVCPWPDLCGCADSTSFLWSIAVYQDCRPPHSNQDPWHTWASAYVACAFVEPQEIAWLTDATKAQQLKNGLVAYAR